MNSATARAKRRPNPFLVLVRVIVVTVAFGVLGMGIGGLMGIIGISIMNAAGVPTDMDLAIFAGAIPGAVIGASVGLVVIVRSEQKAIPKNQPRIPTD